MKLNLGCGNTYKDGFINIDAYNNTVADEQMLVDDLQYPSNSVEQIEAQQLIEHLGFFKTVYSLAEWFRVLKPEGTLTIETPDLETSFKKFLDGDLEVKKNVITWIYGHESEGMAHLFCFPSDLLELILIKTGFTEIKKSFFGKEINQPVLRVQCKKPKKYEMFQTLANFRKKLIKEKIVDINNIYVTLEQENLVDFFISKMKQIQSNGDKAIDEILLTGAVSSPEMAKTLFEECLKNKLIEKNIVKNHIEILDFLIKINFPSVLLGFLKETPVVAGTQNKTCQIIENLGKQTIIKMLGSEEEKNKIKTFLLQTSKKSSVNKKFFFSDDIIKREAERDFQKGVKQYYLKNFKKAAVYIDEAVKTNRNNIFYYWNQARLKTIIKNIKGAKKSYENALKLVSSLKHEKRDFLIKKLKDEIEYFSEKEYNKPILFNEGLNE